MKPIFLNAMSRNGHSLLYQLLADHPQVSLLPGRIHFACREPRGFPLTGPVTDLVEQLLDRHTVDIGEQYQDYQSIPITDFARFPQAEFRRRARASGDLKEQFHAYLRALFEVFDQPPREYTVIQDDHMYALGLEMVLPVFPEARFLQPIRAGFDVVASKKNLMLFHLGHRGDSRSQELTEDALESEWTRWLWSLVVASLCLTQSPADRYVVCGFEALRGAARETAMRELCQLWQLDWHPVLLEETSSACAAEHGFSTLMLVVPTLKLLGSARPTSPVKSYQRSLTETEQTFLARLAEPFQLPELGDTPLQARQALLDFWSANQAAVRAHPRLGQWLQWYEQGEPVRAFDDYSAWNYGRAQAARAFR